MAMNFAKGNRSMAFNPTSAFPLDARSYFESYDAAVAAALTAKEAGDSTTTYYFGQSIVVVENGAASFYIIQPDGTLGEVGGKVEINEKVFAKDEDGKLNLFGFAKAVEGAQLVKGANGELTWVKPDTTTVEGLQTAIESLEAAIENIYTKEEVDQKIAESAHLKRKTFDTMVEAEAFIEQLKPEELDTYVIMVLSDENEAGDKYDEYLIVIVDGVRTLEKVGSWEVNLDDYATKEQVKSLSESIGYTATEDKKTLVETIEETYATKEELLITSVEPTEFTIENKKLGINKIAISKVDGLVDFLNGKVDKEEGKSLISNSLITKVENLKNITNISDEFSLVDGTLSFSTAFNNRLDGFDTTLSGLRTDVDKVTTAVTWGDIE